MTLATMGKNVRWMMALANFFNFFFPVSMATVDPSCDFFQELALGQQYYIYNREYPGLYPASTACRWVAHSPSGSNIVLSCDDIQIPSSTNCQADKLAISLTGNTDLNDARNYCGQGTLSVVTEGNSLAVGLFAASNSQGGRFSCSLTALQSNSSTTTTTPRPIRCDCGWKQSRRIVGGHETGVNEYPFMAAILDRFNGELFCGSSIISERYVLTAAHCLNHRQPSDLGVLVGDHNVSSGADTPAAALYAVSEFKIHPLYNSTYQQNDIAILKTARQIVFSLDVGPVCLPFKYSIVDFYAQTVTALGWGFLDIGGPKSDTLQEVDLQVVSCGSVPDPTSASRQICTYAPDKDQCFADSGGPIIWMDAATRRLQLVGIISYGIGCATTIPGVNTRVTSYLTWVVSVTSDTLYCIK